MDFERVLFHVAHSATLRLLRSKQAPLAMSFFYFAFKLKNRLQIPYSELKRAADGVCRKFRRRYQARIYPVAATIFRPLEQ